MEARRDHEKDIPTLKREDLPAQTAVGIGYMRNTTIEIVQDLTANHSDAAKALRLPLTYAGVMESPYLSLREFD